MKNRGVNMEINLTNAKKMQVLKGFGSSSCWWSQFLKDEKSQEEISELLYGDSGLKLNIYRYNIGGGTDEENFRVSNPWRRSESMYVFDREKEEGYWDFSLDKTAKEVMRRCLDKGNIDTLIVFANSPHWSHTSTGQASGSLLYHTCNLPKMNYRKFADYILTVTQHLIDEGFPVKYVSPINEPQWKWGGSYVWQEGCHYEPEEMAEVFHIFAEEIIKRKMDVKLYGPESGEMFGQTKEYLDLLTKDELVMSVMPIFAYHSYHSDNDVNIRKTFKKEFAEAHPQLRFDMSEWCELPNKSHTKDFKGAMITARIIGQDIIYAGAESWTSWVAVNQFSIKDGLDFSDAAITATDNFEEWYVAERYYGFAHFSKYIPKNSICLDNGFFPDEKNELNTFSFITPENKTVTVIVNEGDDEDVYLGGNFRKMQIIESCQDYKLKTVYKDKFKSNFNVKGQSIVTVICE